MKQNIIEKLFKIYKTQTGHLQRVQFQQLSDDNIVEIILSVSDVDLTYNNNKVAQNAIQHNNSKESPVHEEHGNSTHLSPVDEEHGNSTHLSPVDEEHGNSTQASPVDEEEHNKSTQESPPSQNEDSIDFYLTGESDDQLLASVSLDDELD